MRIHITLAPTSTAKLDGIANRSKYFAALLSDRQADAYQAACILADEGWALADIDRAADTMPAESTELRGMPNPGYVRAVLVVAGVTSPEMRTERHAWALMTALRELALNGRFRELLASMLSA